MAEGLKDILSNLSTDIDQETLLLYLQGQLSADQKHEVEQKLVENDFADDALEGLQEIKDKKQIAYMVEMLNRDLKKKTERKKQRRDKLKLPDQSTLYIAILILIILIVISYLIVHNTMKQSPTG